MIIMGVNYTKNKYLRGQLKHTSHILTEGWGAPVGVESRGG